MPVPLSEMVACVADALLVTEMLPVALPAVVGAYVTVNCVFAPAFTDFGAVRFVVNPVPEIVAAVMFRVALPVFVSVTVWFELLPTLTLPNGTGDGLIVIVACEVVPEPLRLMVTVDGVPFVVSCTDPLTAPDAVGVNTALNVKVPPAAIVDDVVSPAMLIPVPATVIFENVSVALPLFCTVIGCELLLPTATFEKATLDGDAAACACMPVPLNESVAGEPGLVLAI